MNLAAPALPFTLPPELFPVIASFVPLRSAPQTLRALALGSRCFYNIVRPLLYSRLILRNEDNAIDVIQRIMNEPQLGLAVTELYIMSELSFEARKGKKAFNIVAGVQMLIAKGLIPRLIALGLYLLKDWIYAKNFKTISHGRLLADFWINLRNECPRLHTLILRNVGHSFTDPWLTGPVIDEINSLLGLSTLRLEWKGEALEEEDDLKILNNLPRLASSLHTLSLRSGLQEATVLLSLDFPHLKWLRLDSFVSLHDTEKVQGFFKRHPQLESLSLEGCTHTWFSHDIEVGFLPNLRHLKARFEDIRLLVPVLPQLVSLAFTKSSNEQVPYLLRAVLPNGLPQLKSLEIKQDVRGWEDRTLEGILWYETVDGQFRTEENPKKVERDFTNGYMHSIVRGAPNLEELGLDGMTLTSMSLKSLEHTLSQLVKMERFYYQGYSPDPKYDNPPPPKKHKELLSNFLSSAEALARVCTHLESVTSISRIDLPYVSGMIERNSVGEVTAVRPGDGMALQISADENDPFPCFHLVRVLHRHEARNTPLVPVSLCNLRALHMTRERDDALSKRVASAVATME
ncbi:hypothetical protein BJ912DRAFT_926759 [Pholiota molesta]|nr:hypothetical protein BJ912DRAFT_926759 [Pholiota molesta]